MNFEQNNAGYSKKEVNEFVDYVISKTEENILTIKRQKDEIESLRKEVDRLTGEISRYERSLNDNMRNSIQYEADLIIREAKDNASRIVNDALLKSKELNREREMLKENMRIYKRRLKNAMREHLDSIEDIEIL